MVAQFTEIRPVPAQDSWAKELFRHTLEIFYQALYAQILRILDPPKTNAKDSALVAALRAGKVIYHEGEFKGDFSASISRELLDLGAVFDGRSKSYRIAPSRLPGPLHQWVMQQNEATRMQVGALLASIVTVGERVEAALSSVDFADLAAKVEAKFDDGLASTLGTVPRITPLLRDSVKTEYTESTILAIRNFTAEEAVKLRELVEEQNMMGFRAEKLVPQIYARQRVSVDRAKFVAQQETKLFVSTLQKVKYTQAGITHYKWKTVGDAATRPEHAELNGKIFSWNDPPVSDNRTGRRRHPGTDYGCRCIAIPLVGYQP